MRDMYIGKYVQTGHNFGERIVLTKVGINLFCLILYVIVTGTFGCM